MTSLPVVNIPALRDEIARREPPSGSARTPWVLRRVAMLSAVVYLVAFAFPALVSGTAHRAFSAPALWIELAASLVVAAAITTVLLRAARRPVELRAQESAERLQRDWAQMTQGSWYLRVLLWGAGMAVVIGLVVGTILAARLPQTELVSGSRELTVLVFIAVTLAWCLPAAFAIRWIWLRWARRFTVAA